METNIDASIVDSSLHTDFNLTKLQAMRELAEVRLKYINGCIQLWHTSRELVVRPCHVTPYLKFLYKFQHRQLQMIVDMDNELNTVKRKY